MELNTVTILMSLSWATTGIKLGLIMCIMTLGVHIAYRILDTADLSIEGTFPLGCCVAAILIFFKVPAIIATIIAMIVGSGAGFITGILHTKLKIPMILAGIITMTGLYSINLAILGFSDPNYLTVATLSFGDNTTVFSWFKELLVDMGMKVKMANNVSTLTISALFLVVVYVIMYWFFGTELGMAIRSTGDNKTMSKAQGINTNKMTILGLMLSNGLIALAGALFAQNSATANVTSGRGMIVVGLAAIIIGEVIFGRKTYKSQLVSLVVGTCIYYLLRAIAIELNVIEFLDLASAVLIVIILALPLIKTKILKNKKRGVANA